METNEVFLDETMIATLPSEAQGFIKTEGFQLTREVTDLKVTNRDQYKKACEIGISNANILKRLEDLRKAMIKPLDIEKNRLNESFEKASAIFTENDEKIRALLESYQDKVNVENIKTIHTEAGRATVQERKDWEVEDLKKIPAEYFKLDETKIGKIVRAGGSIPGIKVTTAHSTAFVAS